jgi:hypothetical protein
MALLVGTVDTQYVVQRHVTPLRIGLFLVLFLFCFVLVKVRSATPCDANYFVLHVHEAHLYISFNVTLQCIVSPKRATPLYWARRVTV